MACGNGTISWSTVSGCVITVIVVVVGEWSGHQEVGGRVTAHHTGDVTGLLCSAETRGESGCNDCVYFNTGDYPV